MAIIAQRAADVRINEKDLSSFLVSNSTASAALVVVSNQGPAGDPVLCTSADQFLSRFGQPNAKISFDHYSAVKFFEEGNSLWAVRAVGADARTACAIAKVNASGNTVIAQISGGLADPENPAWGDLVSVGETPLFLVYAKNGPGSYGDNLAVSIESSNLEKPQGLAATTLPSDGFIEDGTYRYVVTAVSKTIPGTTATETIASDPFSLTISGGGATARASLTWTAVAGAAGYHIYKEETVGGEEQFSLLARVGAATPAYIDDGSVELDSTIQPAIVSGDLGAPASVFTLHVYDTEQSSTSPVESMVVSLKDITDETGVQMEIESKINPYSTYINAQSNWASIFVEPTIKNTTVVSLKGGTSGTAPTSSQIMSAWNKFLDKERYIVDVLIGSGRTSVAVQKHMELIARTRGECVAFLDVPSAAQTAQAAVDWRNIDLNINSSYAALFGPDILVIDPVSSRTLYIPPSGAMAALYARTSRLAAPWFSIAGLNRGLINCLAPRYSYDDGQSTAMYAAQVNYIRKFLGRGIALWEQSTLSNKASALQFLNVRQLLNILKRAMYSYLLYNLQEPNDEILRRQIQFALEQYLDTIQQARGISSYRVDVGDVLNTPSYVNSGILRIACVIVPILAVREIQLSIVLNKEGVELSEDEVAAIA